MEIVAVEVTEQESGGAGAHEAIKRLIEKSGGGGNADLMGEIAADGAAPGAGIVRFADAGEQEKACGVESPRGEKNERRGLKEFFTCAVNIGHAASRGFAGGVKEHSANPGADTKRNVLALLDDGEKDVGGLSFSADHAAKPAAEATICAAATRNAIGICVCAADVCGGSRIGVVAERFRGVSK